MYNWRLRDKNNSTTDTALIARLVDEYNKYCTFLSRTGSPNISILNASQYSKVIYVHAEIGDDTDGDGSPQNPYRTLQGAVSNADNPVTSATVVVACGRFSTDLNVNNALLVADVFGCVVIDSSVTVSSIHVGCYASYSTSINGRWTNCIIDCRGFGFANGHGAIKCGILNMVGVSQGFNQSMVYEYCAFINCRIQSNISHPMPGSSKWYGNVFVNSELLIYTEIAHEDIFMYNSNVQILKEESTFEYYDIVKDGGFQSLSDCFVDPNHLCFDLKRSAMSNTIFAGWLGWTGDSVDFVQVVGDNIQEDSGSYTIDQQTPGDGFLVSAILDNRGKFNRVFTGFSTPVFHYNTNNIAICPWHRYETPVILSAGEQTLTVSAETMFSVGADCTIGDTAVGKYATVLLDAGSYTVVSSGGVKFFPYRYNTINNFVQVRFANLGRCSTVAAGTALKVGCSYLNQTGAAVTTSDGKTVQAGGTYICQTAGVTASGALLLVFDDAVDNYTTFSTQSFQTKFKAGYIVTNSKYSTPTNLLTKGGKTIPLTEAFGEFNLIEYLDSVNRQEDFFQIRVDYEVYNFDI